MSEMLDRVVKAIWEHASLSCAHDRCTCSGNEKWECLTGTNPEELARAAVKAMREPTQEMLSAENVHPSCHMCGGHADGWKAMIDAALDTPSEITPNQTSS